MNEKSGPDWLAFLIFKILIEYMYRLSYYSCAYVVIFNYFIHSGIITFSCCERYFWQKSA